MYKRSASSLELQKQKEQTKQLEPVERTEGHRCKNEVLSYLELRAAGGITYLYGTGRLSESLGEIV